MTIDAVIGMIKKVKIYDILIYSAFVLFMVLAVENKVNMHVDEVYSYGLSNSTQGIIIMVEDGFTYYPSNTPWITYMAVDAGERFQYDAVWQNQSDDVHPPMYYAILHTICSFLPGAFSIWFAAVINILFALGALFFLRKLILLLTRDEWVQRLVSIAFICSAGILSAVTFMRMYIMTIFWTAALTYVIIKQIGMKNNFKNFIAIFICTAGGALTHYYCIIYAVFLSVFYVCYLILNKRWKETGFFCLTQAAAAVVSIAVFPSMLTHIFRSSRGKEAFGNIGPDNLSNGRTGQFWHMIDIDLFGGLLTYIVGVFVILFIVNECWRLYRTLSREDTITAVRYVGIICPTLLYFLLISRIAGYVTNRYMYPIYGVLFVATVSGISVWCRRVMKIQYKYLLALILVVITVNGWRSDIWTYLFQSSGPLLEAAAEHPDTDCVYVYDTNWKINPSYKEVSCYNSVTFYQPSDLDMLSTSDLSTRYELIVTAMSDSEEILGRIMELCPALNAYEYLGSYGYTETYYLYGLH